MGLRGVLAVVNGGCLALALGRLGIERPDLLAIASLGANSAILALVLWALESTDAKRWARPVLSWLSAKALLPVAVALLVVSWFVRTATIECTDQARLVYSIGQAGPIDLSCRPGETHRRRTFGGASVFSIRERGSAGREAQRPLAAFSANLLRFPGDLRAPFTVTVTPGERSGCSQGLLAEEDRTRARYRLLFQDPSGCSCPVDALWCVVGGKALPDGVSRTPGGIPPWTCPSVRPAPGEPLVAALQVRRGDSYQTCRTLSFTPQEDDRQWRICVEDCHGIPSPERR